MVAHYVFAETPMGLVQTTLVKKYDQQIRLPDVLEHQGLSLYLLSKRFMSLILEKHLVLGYFPVSLKILEQL